MAAHVREVQTALEGVPEFYARLAELERAVERAESGYSSLPAPSLEGAANQVPDGDRLQQTVSRLLQTHALETDSLEPQFAAVQALAQTISRVSVLYEYVMLMHLSLNKMYECLSQYGLG